MWNKRSLRFRITILSTLCLASACFLLTALLNIKAASTYAVPIQSLTDAEFLKPSAAISSIPAQRILPATDTVEAMEAYQAAKSDFAWQSILYMFFITALGGCLTWIITGRALNPVTKLSKIIENIDENNLKITIPPPKSCDEISALTNSFNHMLIKVNQAYEGQKRFAQNAAHELKTPVTAMMASLEVLELEESPSAEDYKETTEVLALNTKRMHSLVQDMLLLNSSFQSQELERFYASKLLSDILMELEEEREKKGIDIQLYGDLLLIGNKPLLKCAFYNLLHNSIRYNIQDGSIFITCSEHTIRIQDSGPGIAKEHIDKIFEPFYCIDPSRSRELGGSGLGLSIVKQILDKHNYKIEIFNEPGAVFLIDITS